MPTLGAIRWDSGNSGPIGTAETLMMGPSQWDYRLPFYGTRTDSTTVVLNGDDQATMDSEILRARAGGVDYWAFDYYPNDPGWPYVSHSPGDPFRVGMTYGLQRYLSSSQNNLVKYCLLTVEGVGFDSSTFSSAQWPACCDAIVIHMLRSQYMTVLSGRPLIYFYFTNPWYESAWDTNQHARDGITLLRAKAQSAGLPNPYIVRQDGGNDLGFDATSTYAFFPDNGVNIFPYSTLTADAVSFWSAWKSQMTGKLIPVVTSGWDFRPRLSPHNPYGIEDVPYSSYVRPTPAQLAAHVQSAADFMVANPSNCEADTILAYAWNEFTEGGWICPTHSTTGMELQLISQTLKRQRERKTALKRRGLQLTTR